MTPPEHLLKFRYSEKALKKIEKISHFVLTLLSNFKKGWEIFSNFVAVLEYLNFTYVTQVESTINFFQPYNEKKFFENVSCAPT